MRRLTLLLLLIPLLLLGAAPPSGDLPGWRVVMIDDFTQTVPEGSVSDGGIANWPYAYRYPDTSARSDGTRSAWDPATISVHDGYLDYHLHTVNGVALSGAVGQDYSQVYGRYDVRMKADAIPGYKTAFLLWPDSEQWPRDGEIDFPEGDLNSTVGGATHYQGGTSGNSQDVFDTSATYGDWHTYSIAWTPAYVAYSIDGTEVHRTTKKIPNTPMHWVLQSESWIGSGQPPASADGHVLIDWAIVYAYAPGTQPSATPTPTATATRTPTAAATATPAATATATRIPPTSTTVAPTATKMPTATATPPVATTTVAPPTVTPAPARSVTLPCAAYTVNPDGRGGTTFTCLP